LTAPSFTFYDRERALLAEGPELLARADPLEIKDYTIRLLDRFEKVVRENEDLTRHSDRQEQRLVKLNKNLKTQARDLEERQTKLESISKNLARYLPPQIHEALFSGQHETAVVTKRKKLTIFFSDIRGFTEIAENLQPEELTDTLNEYFSEMTEIALAHGATIDKYIGDAIMIFFGDPESKGVREDARACVTMALQMQNHMRSLRKRWQLRGFSHPFEIRIGINTGFCNVGNFGSEQRLSYTIIGGEVNLAQRIESIADPGGILISADTYAHVIDLVEGDERESVSLKGIDRKIKTYAISGRKQSRPQSFKISHPAGVSVDLDRDQLSEAERKNLADQLRSLADDLS
jgi:class 3 adenylate cyclase